jgi:hypothetical protein
MKETHALTMSAKKTYTKLLFFIISAGINVNTGKNQHVSHVYIATAGLNIQSTINGSSKPRAKNHHV